MKDKILVFGEGFIGAKIKEHFGCPVSTKRINSSDDIDSEAAKHNAQIMINCIGFTGATVGTGAGAGAGAGICGTPGILDKSKLDKSGSVRLLKSMFDKSGIGATGTGAGAGAGAGAGVGTKFGKG